MKFTTEKIDVPGRAPRRIIDMRVAHNFLTRADDGSYPHRFEPSLATTSTINLTAGSWIRRHIIVTSSAASGIGSSTNKYIIATLNDANTPTTLAISAVGTMPSAIDLDTKRMICELVYTDGSISNIVRYQADDIKDDLLKGASDGDMKVWDATAETWKILPVPSSPAILSWDSTNGIHWTVLSAKWQIAHRNESSQIVGSYLRFKS